MDTVENFLSRSASQRAVCHLRSLELPTSATRAADRWSVVEVRYPNHPATSTMMWASANVQILMRPSTDTPVITTFGTVWLET
jgi:hypothetical protein